MDDPVDEKAKARRAILILNLCMFGGIGVIVLLFVLRHVRL